MLIGTRQTLVARLSGVIRFHKQSQCMLSLNTMIWSKLKVAQLIEAQGTDVSCQYMWG